MLELTIEQPLLWHNELMAEQLEDRLLRVDIYDLENELDSIKARLDLLPTQRELTHVAFLAFLAGAALVLIGITVLSRLV